MLIRMMLFDTEGNAVAKLPRNFSLKDKCILILPDGFHPGLLPAWCPDCREPNPGRLNDTCTHCGKEMTVGSEWSIFCSLRSQIIKRFFSTPPLMYAGCGKCRPVHFFSITEVKDDYPFLDSEPGICGPNSTRFGSYFKFRETDPEYEKEGTRMGVDAQGLKGFVERLYFEGSPPDVWGDKLLLFAKDLWCKGKGSSGLVGVVAAPLWQPDEHGWDCRPGGTAVGGEFEEFDYFVLSQNPVENIPIVPQVFLHEFGHACGLADEYWYDTSTSYPHDSTWDDNVCCKKELVGSGSVPNDVKIPEEKAAWLRNMTPGEIAAITVPYKPDTGKGGYLSMDATKEEANRRGGMDWLAKDAYWDRVILCEGACYVGRNIYRSNLNCIMRDEHHIAVHEVDGKNVADLVEFCRVCHNVIKDRMKQEQD